MAEKGRIVRCGCNPRVPQHEHKDGIVVRYPKGAILIELPEGNQIVDTCLPAEATHVHSSDCYASGSVCMSQPFGTMTSKPT